MVGDGTTAGAIGHVSIVCGAKKCGGVAVVDVVAVDHNATTNVGDIAYRKLIGRPKIRGKSANLSAYLLIYRHIGQFIGRFILSVGHREAINRLIYRNIGRYLEQWLQRHHQGVVVVIVSDDGGVLLDDLAGWDVRYAVCNTPDENIAHLQSEPAGAGNDGVCGLRFSLGSVFLYGGVTEERLACILGVLFSEWKPRSGIRSMMAPSSTSFLGWKHRLGVKNYGAHEL